MASDKIHCTFEGCYQVFDTVESMKKHKSKAEDELHEFYCKKCDEDCEDDIAYLIHQIQSRKHSKSVTCIQRFKLTSIVACPVCGKEFKSEGGRERHVGINHRHKQELKCPGCKVMFDSASALMGHIEHNKCRTITRDDFYKHRAEKEIVNDAVNELNGTAYQNATQITSIGSVGSDPDSSNGGMSLLDNERVHLERDWQGNPRSDPRLSAQHNSQTQGDPLSQGFSDLSINRYPPLMATRTQPRHKQNVVPTWPVQNNSDLIDVQEEPEVRPSKPKTIIGDNNVWGSNNQLVQSRSQPQNAASSSSNPPDTASSLNLLGSTMSANTAATRGTTNHNNNHKTNTIPPSARPENQDPNAPYTQIQLQPSKPRLPSRLELHRYWDTIQSCYVCPGARCGQKITSVSAFEAHLLSAAHVGAKVQCPTCLKKFKTATALVAHAESGSIKCDLRNSLEYDKVMRDVTAGLIKVDGTWRDGTVKYDSVDVDQW